MHVSAHDVARELRSQLPLSGVTKIHKLLYLSQGWHLAWYGEPLFVEDIEAYDNGPVVADLWRDERDQRRVPTPEQLSGGQLLVVDYVVSNYGSLSARELIDLTHAEGPWVEAYGRDWSEGKVIKADAMRDFFIAAERADADHADEDAADQWGLNPTGLVEVEAGMATASRSLPDAGPRVDEADDIRRWLAELIS